MSPLLRAESAIEGFARPDFICDLLDNYLATHDNNDKPIASALSMLALTKKGLIKGSLRQRLSRYFTSQQAVRPRSFLKGQLQAKWWRSRDGVSIATHRQMFLRHVRYVEQPRATTARRQERAQVDRRECHAVAPYHRVKSSDPRRLLNSSAARAVRKGGPLVRCVAVQTCRQVGRLTSVSR